MLSLQSFYGRACRWAMVGELKPKGPKEKCGCVGPSADVLVLVCVRHEPPGPNSHPFEDYPLAGSAAILCTGGPDVIRKEAWSFYRTSSGVRLCWEFEEPKGPKGVGVWREGCENEYRCWLLTDDDFRMLLLTPVFSLCGYCRCQKRQI